jgi:hypothetical protein
MTFYASGNKFAGKWENDKQEGYGIMYWFDRGEIYKGEWKHGAQSGQGEHVWLDQNAEDKDSSNSTQKQMCNRYKVSPQEFPLLRILYFTCLVLCFLWEVV